MIYKSLSKEQGVSLMEVLISLFVLAIGVLGVLALQVQSTRFNNQSYSLTQAVFLANNMAEAIRANKDIAASYAEGDIDVATSQDLTCQTGTCTAEQVKNTDLQNWSYQLQSMLPNGRGKITGAPPEMLITIEFDSTTAGMDFEVDGWQRYSMVVGI